MVDLIGHDIGRYHITEQLGQGGMAVVYRAYDTRLERDVAIKVIRMENFGTAVSGHMLKRFEREGKSLAKMMHPNIVPIYDFGEHEGSPYLVMGYIPGGTLKLQTGKPMPYAEAARIAAPVARALAYAHSMNIIHRDVKPANILITAAGEPMLSDFGVAKILDLDEGGTLTGTGVGVGTPEYMAPEQWLNQVVPQTDVYALGVVFYELVTGRKPYTADTPAAVLIKQREDPLPRPQQFVPGLPEQVEQVIFKALARKPEDRYENMAEFAAALEKLAAQADSLPAVLPVPAASGTRPGPADDRPTVDILPQAGQPVQKGRVPFWVFILGGAALVALLAFEVLGAWIPGRAAAAAPTAPPAAVAPVSTLAATAVVTTAPPSPAALGIGSTRVSAKDGMKQVYVPAGEFLMGSDSGNNDEKPVHLVYLDDFWIDKTVITNAMYAKCMSVGNCDAPAYQNDTRLNGGQQPVVGVDWNQAKAYCAWAGRRLPTEAEWEKAARGSDGDTYPWGNQAPNNNLLNDNQDVGGTVAVGSYPEGASPYGALDMAGNVAEWVADWYSDTYYQKSADRNPTGPDSGQYRVLRGGSWGNNVFDGRSSVRVSEYPTYQSRHDGFRCAQSADSAQAENTPTTVPTPQPSPLPQQASTGAGPTSQATLLPTPNGKLVLDENFETGTAVGFRPKSGIWDVVEDGSGNKVYQTNTLSSNNYVEFGPDKFSDGTIQYRFKVLEWDLSALKDIGIAVIFFRIRGVENYDSYAFQVVLNGGNLCYVSSDNSSWPALNGFDLNIVKNKWYQIQVEVTGNRFKIYVNGQPEIYTIDSESRVNSGRIGFETGPETTVEFDDVKVWQSNQ